MKQETLTDYLNDILQDKNIDISGVQLEKSIDNKSIFKVKYKDKFKYIGSKYNTVNDINNFLYKFKTIKIDTLLIVFGIGTGEHIYELMKILNDFNRVLIIEPDIRILKSFLNLENSINILKDSRISIVNLDNDTLTYLLGSFMENEINFNNWVLSVYSNYNKLYESDYIFFLRKFKDVLRSYESNMATEYLLNKKFMNTYLNNIKSIAQSHMINEFKNKFKGYTAIIVSAGPSLDKNINMLKTLDDNAVIICGNRTLAPLLKLEINPHFMCSIDCSDLIYDMTKEHLNKNIPLVFTETTNSKLVENQIGEKIFFRYSATKTDIENILNEDIESLYFGGSVAHNCTDFARYLGCDTIIFIGQDLAYTNNESHSESTAIDVDEKMNGDKRFIKVKDINGDEVYTTRPLESFRYSLESYIKLYKNIKFIDSTEGGAKIEGTKIITLKKSIKQYAVKKGVSSIIDTLFGTKEYKNVKFIKKNIGNDLTELLELKDKLQDVVNSVEDAVDYNQFNRIDNVNYKISQVNSIIENNHGSAFINFLIQDIVNRGSKYFRYEQNHSKIEDAKTILNAFRKLYCDIIEAIEYITPSIEKCIKNL
ncbi:motility associated factor glycosyltransferase family protein [Clostridium tyrobutyricum]|uniref:motility associated factor glycosyltransferase family protein n=1 Tax=Clostridium tyrobutyricum TaxID=1519 RepID=UPI0018AB2169|nr:6-hydroxymethylpterin diphosphokinase MptE-like protein [Clostridium tyrobutyricum]